MSEPEYHALIKHLTFMRDIYFQRPELAGISTWVSQQIKTLREYDFAIPTGVTRTTKTGS